MYLDIATIRQIVMMVILAHWIYAKRMVKFYDSVITGAINKQPREKMIEDSDEDAMKNLVGQATR